MRLSQYWQVDARPNQKIQVSNLDRCTHIGGMSARKSLRGLMRVNDEEVTKAKNELDKIQHNIDVLRDCIKELQEKYQANNRKQEEKEALIPKAQQLLDIMTFNVNILPVVCNRDTDDEQFKRQIEVLDEKLVNWDEDKDSALELARKKLISTASQKIKEFLLNQIEKIGRPNTNIKTIKSILLDNKSFNHFLGRHAPNEGKVVMDEYVFSMQQTYHKHFRRSNGVYKGKLTEKDFMGVEECAAPFNLNGRLDIFDEDFQNYNYDMFEHKFKVLHHPFVGISYNEYKFICKFFLVREEEAGFFFQEVMTSSLEILHTSLQDDIGACLDAYGLLLAYQLLVRSKNLYEKSIPVLHDYWLEVEEKLWSRFEYIFQRHIDSILRIDKYKFDKNMAAHYVSKRFAQFCTSINQIMSYAANVKVGELLEKLLHTVNDFIVALSKQLDTAIDQLIFLINNYETILEHLDDSFWEVDLFKDKLDSKMQSYSELILMVYFEEMILFTNRSENMQAHGLDKELRRIQEKSEWYAKHFADTWKKSFEELNAEISASFQNIRTTTNLLENTLMRLRKYIKRFYGVLPEDARKHIKISEVLNEIVECKIEL